VSGGVGRAKIVLDVVFRYACGDFAPSALPAAKTLAFDATIHFVRCSKLEQQQNRQEDAEKEKTEKK
jgi:hypothetical protein